MARKSDKPALEVGDEAVKKATGKTWPQWFSVLDKAGCKGMNHKQIVAVVHDKFEVGPWWRQMVTVGYEQARGLREKHQTARGYSISRSKTFAVPIGTLFAAWKDVKVRGRWLQDAGLTIRKATTNKSLRITWVDGKTNVDVLFTKKGAAKSQVAVQHGKLPDARSGVKMKDYWGGALDRLAAVLQ